MSGFFLVVMPQDTQHIPPEVEKLLAGRSSQCRIYKSGAGTKAFLARMLLARGADVALFARNEKERSELAGLLQLLCGHNGADAMWRRQWSYMPGAAPGTADRRIWPRRLACLFTLAMRRTPRITLATTDVLLLKLPPRNIFDENHLELTRGEELSPDMVLEQAADWGYERSAMVTRPGEMAMRGDILDIFTPGYDYALRVEFFGDVIEELRLFDPATQRSVTLQGRGKGNSPPEAMQSALILPAAPNLGGPAADSAAQQRFAQLASENVLSQEQAASLQRQVDSGVRQTPPGVYYHASSHLEQWLPPETVCIVDGPDVLAEDLDQHYWNWSELLQNQEDGVPVGLCAREPKAAMEALSQRRRIQFHDLAMGEAKEGVDLPEIVHNSFDSLFARQAAVNAEHRDRPWRTLVDSLKEWERSRPQTILGFHSQASRRKFLKLAEEEGLRPRLDYAPSATGLFALVSPFSGGKELQWRQMLMVSEDLLQPRSSSRPPAPDKTFQGLAGYDDLTPGELLVHRDYGLGRFEGLESMDLGGTSNDFLLLRYSGDDKLYLPVDRMGLVQRFKAPEEAAPALDRLGGSGWVRTREKARKAIEKIAKDLVEMYAYRRIAKGYAYTAPGNMYREFEASFGFEETPGQEKAIADVLRDMELPEPMDRLVCGDVGFGKTEVALRAAFRAALEGRQVALLCPTTVLAEQHYQTFRSRMREFPVNVAMLSRFVSPKKQKTVLEAASQGQVDILIGTHRLLSKDVKLPNLGLLVLDEEQRFGVKHKERLKQLKKNVDSLTLTATPIPRTLQLSLSGVRGLSLIETAPLDRKPVETSLLARDDAVLRAVLQRELDRKGQIFWVHNRVQGLERVAEYVRTLAPQARVAMAHGQMTERALEEAMHGFWHGELDVLVCTAIVESGLDFPKANTLVVDGAQMFGLGQLYQLRGRVGRSERQAYAYFVVPDAERLPDKARKRLQIILDMDYLGAGFQVAMEDLRLRGAGNILGEVQSGHIAKVGLDLFLEMLEEEVRKLQGKPVRLDTEPELTIGFEARIPESYMEDSRERLKYYKALTAAVTPEARADIAAEIRDRFGPLPPAAVNFVAVLGLKRRLSELQAAKAEIFPGKLRLHWPEDAGAVSPEGLVEWFSQRPNTARLIPPTTLEMRLDETHDLPRRLEEAAKTLAGLLQQPEGLASEPAET